MARVRTLIARRSMGIAALAVAMLLPAGLGCTSMKDTRKQVAQSLGFDKSQPASQMICFWQRRPQHLPDPSRDGIMSPGLVGQLFLISPDSKPVDITGELVVQAIDETPRPKGQASAVPEIWQIDKTTLKKLATKDDRFGNCYAIFLPWPASWKDVTNVRMQAKYISKPSPDLFASDVQMTLEFGDATGSAWQDKGGGPMPKMTGPTEMRGIPDLAKAFQNQPAMNLGLQSVHQAASQTAQTNSKGFVAPPLPPNSMGQPTQYTTPGPDGSMIQTKVWTAPPPSGPPMNLQNPVPTVIPPPAQPMSPPGGVVYPPAQPLPTGLPYPPPNYDSLPSGPLPTVTVPRQ